MSLLPKPFSEQIENLLFNLDNVPMYKDWNKIQIYPNVHIHSILAAKWLMDLHEISQSFLSLSHNLQKPLPNTATNLWHTVLLPNTFLDFRYNKEDPYLPTYLFSMDLPFSKIQYCLFNNYLIFTMTIPIHSTTEFHLFKIHSTPIYFDFNTDYTLPTYIKPQVSHTAISSYNGSYNILQQMKVFLVHATKMDFKLFVTLRIPY